MINKQDNKEQDTKPGNIDTAKMDVQCHLLIKDKDANRVLVNKRG